MQVVTFQRQRERQAEELLLTPGEMAARCDWQQVRRMREEMPDDVCSTHAWYQNCDALDRELRAQYPMIGALETAVRGVWVRDGEQHASARAGDDALAADARPVRHLGAGAGAARADCGCSRGAGVLRGGEMSGGGLSGRAVPFSSLSETFCGFTVAMYGIIQYNNVG